MKQTLALLATLLGVGLANVVNQGDAGFEGLDQRMKDLHVEKADTANTIHAKGASEAITEHSGTKEALKQKVEPFNLENMLAEFQKPLSAGTKDTINKLAAKLEDPDFLKELLKNPNAFEKVVQKFEEISQDPAFQEAVEKFAKQPAVQQCIAAAEEMAAVAMIEEGMFLADSILDALAQPVLYQPVVIEFATFPVVDTVELPKNIAALEKKEKYHGNLFQALDLHKSIFHSEEAQQLVKKAQVPGCDEDAMAVQEYLVKDHNAKRYHQLMVEEKKMTLPQQEKPKQQEKPEPTIVDLHEDAPLA